MDMPATEYVAAYIKAHPLSLWDDLRQFVKGEKDAGKLTEGDAYAISSCKSTFNNIKAKLAHEADEQTENIVRREAAAGFVLLASSSANYSLMEAGRAHQSRGRTSLAGDDDLKLGSSRGRPKRAVVEEDDVDITPRKQKAKPNSELSTPPGSITRFRTPTPRAPQRKPSSSSYRASQTSPSPVSSSSREGSMMPPETPRRGYSDVRSPMAITPKNLTPRFERLSRYADTTPTPAPAPASVPSLVPRQRVAPRTRRILELMAERVFTFEQACAIVDAVEKRNTMITDLVMAGVEIEDAAAQVDLEHPELVKSRRLSPKLLLPNKSITERCCLAYLYLLVPSFVFVDSLHDDKSRPSSCATHPGY